MSVSQLSARVQFGPSVAIQSASAEIVTVPGATAVTRPDASTSATDVSPLLHATVTLVTHPCRKLHGRAQRGQIRRGRTDHNRRHTGRLWGRRRGGVVVVRLAVGPGGPRPVTMSCNIAPRPSSTGRRGRTPAESTIFVAMSIAGRSAFTRVPRPASSSTDRRGSESGPACSGRRPGFWQTLSRAPAGPELPVERARAPNPDPVGAPWGPPRSLPDIETT